MSKGRGKEELARRGGKEKRRYPHPGGGSSMRLSAFPDPQRSWKAMAKQEAGRVMRVAREGKKKKAKAK